MLLILLPRNRTTTFISAVIVSAVLVGSGCQLLQESNHERLVATTYKRPTTLTISRFSNKPQSGLFEITGGVLNLTRASYHVLPSRHGDAVTQVLFAYIPVGTDESNKPASLVYLTEDRGILHTMAQWEALNNSASGMTKAQRERWLTKNHDKLFLRRDLIGETSYPKNADGKTAQGMAPLLPDLAPQWVWMRDSDVPTVKSADSKLRLAFFVLAFPAVGWLLWLGGYLLGKRQERELHLVSAEINQLRLALDRPIYTVHDKEDSIHRSMTGLDLRQMLDSHKITPETLVKNEETGTIQPIYSVPGLLPEAV